MCGQKPRAQDRLAESSLEEAECSNVRPQPGRICTKCSRLITALRIRSARPVANPQFAGSRSLVRIAVLNGSTEFSSSNDVAEVAVLVALVS